VKRRQSNQYDMGGAVAGVLDKYSAVWSGKAAAVTKRGLLSSALGRVKDGDSAQRANSGGGERKWKVKAKKHLANLAGIVSSGMRAYAGDIKDFKLAAEFRRSVTTIYKLNDTECLIVCKLLRGYVSSNLAALADYNIDGTVLGEFDAAITAFKTLQNAPARAGDKVGAGTREVKEGLQDMLRALKWWDLFIGTLRRVQPEFYTAYRWSRRTHKFGVRHISVRGVVKAEGSGTRLFKVKVSVVDSPHKCKTGKSGKFAVYSLQPGDHTLVFELWGYETVRVQSVPVHVGKIKELVVEMRQLAISALGN
jgi:hypothetical protein